MGADLVKINSKEEHSYVYRTQKSLGFQSCWLGLIKGANDRFYWSDGSSLNYTRWEAADSGKNADKGKDCAELNGSYWRRVPCERDSEARQFACQKSKRNLTRTDI